MRHDAYFVGEHGFTEVKYNGWESVFRVYGVKQLYIFTSDHRSKIVDIKDAEIILETIVDGVRIFDKVEG